MVDLRKREFLAQPVALPLVAREVNRLRIQERFVQPVQLQLNRCLSLTTSTRSRRSRWAPHAALDFGRSVLDVGRELLPRIEHTVLYQL
jgi:hypothetical protein